MPIIPRVRVRSLVALLCIVLSPLTGAQETSEGFTLDQILGARFPSGLVASGTGERIAWVQYERGRRNIWIADAPGYAGRAVTSYAEDDGQQISGLAFLPDAGALVFVRGGAPNRAGEIPNPRSLTTARDRAIWLVSLNSAGESAPRRLAEGSSPHVSPDGATVAFLRAGQVWTVPTAAAEGESEGESESEPSQLLEVRGVAGSLRWSPDGSRLALVSQRGDHAFLGVFDLESGSLRYLDVSMDHDQDPVWSPDGRRLAYMREPDHGDALPFEPRRSAEPWSIRVVDVTTGEAHQAWIADDGDGSAFRGVVAANQILWGKSDRIVFPWERDGWTHLYSVPAAGGPALLLTPGEFDVEHVSLHPDRGHVLYSSNQGDIDRRHLWRVSVTGGPATPVTSGEGLEWAPVPVAGTSIACLASNAKTPAHVAIIDGSDAPRTVTGSEPPDDFPAGLVEPTAVVFPAADGMPIHGQLFLPPDQAPGTRQPAVLYLHGGSRRQMLLGFHYSSYYHNAYAFNQYLASRGYIVLSVNYRSGIGYGMQFREALGYGARGASEFQDVLGAGRYLAIRSDVDPEAIGLWGGSYGGFLTALGLARASDLFAAGVDLHGVHDWNVVIQNFVDSYDPEVREEAAQLAHDSSPIAFLDTWRSPVLLIHGDDDRNVPFSESVTLAARLRERGVPFEQLVFPDEVHSFLLHENWLTAMQAAADFLDRHLRGMESEAELVARARMIHSRVLTLDTHKDISSDLASEDVPQDPAERERFLQRNDPRVWGTNQVDFPKMRAGGLDVAFFIVYVGQGPHTEEGFALAAQQAQDKFDAIHRMARRFPDDIEIAYSADDVERIAKSGKLVACIGIENGFAMGTDLGRIAEFHRLGARYMSLVHNRHSQLGDSHTPADEPLHGGLSELGALAIEQLNLHGIMVDVSHASKQTMLDAVAHSQAPVIASHSGVDAVRVHGRNLDDEQLLALKENGGVIQMVAFASYVKDDAGRSTEIAALREELDLPRRRGGRPADTPEITARRKIFRERMKAIEARHPRADVQDFADHIDHAVRLIGIEHVAISSDFDGGGGITGWNDASETFQVTLELVRRGYTENEIASLWSGNTLRLWRAVERVAARLQADGEK
ncbi:MAG: membrane dipeptidase [Planctomycetota bacterium]